MDWDDAREVVRRGFAVESHTCNHVVLSEETEEEQLRELTDARRRLQDELDIAVSAVAYPHGSSLDYDAKTLAAARSAGYRWGVTTREGFTRASTAALEIRRCVIYPERGVVDLIAHLRYLLENKVRRNGS
jgi:peptidoglycan/xylan/chitin deacetylase (PgdA/CDA1 family)